MGQGLSPIRFAGVSSVTSDPGDNDPEVGSIYEVGDERYMWVYNDGTDAQINPGHCATISSVTGYSVTVSTTTSADFVVGVCKHATITTGAYGFLLVRGFGPVEAEEDASAAAGELIVAAADGTVTFKSISTGYVGNVIGKTVEAIASGASGSAFISCF